MLLLFEIGLLVIQYVLGMWVNLFVQFPNNLPNGNAWSWGMTHCASLFTHIILGSLIVLIAVIVFGMSIVYRKTVIITLSTLGLLALLSAWLNGDEFMVHSQEDITSFQMAIGLIVALVFYSVEVYALFRNQHTSSLKEK
jgi:hypothetical protein